MDTEKEYAADAKAELLAAKEAAEADMERFFEALDAGGHWPEEEG